MSAKIIELGEKVRDYQLTPCDSHKSFYGKARVEVYERGRVLISYTTAVIVEVDGETFDTWGGWSATTGRHIRAFCGKNKHEVDELPRATFERTSGGADIITD